MSEPAVCITGLTKLYPIPLRRQKVVAVKNLEPHSSAAMHSDRNFKPRLRKGWYAIS